MKTLDETIKYCNEEAEAWKKDAERLLNKHSQTEATEKYVNECVEAAEFHEQLAEWLKELKERREIMEMIKKHYILVEKGVRDNPDDLMIGRAPTVEPQNDWGGWGISEVRCPNCLEYFNTDCYSKGELNKCPSCGAKMKGGAV